MIASRFFEWAHVSLPLLWEFLDGNATIARACLTSTPTLALTRSTLFIWAETSGKTYSTSISWIIGLALTASWTTHSTMWNYGKTGMNFQLIFHYHHATSTTTGVHILCQFRIPDIHCARTKFHANSVNCRFGPAIQLWVIVRTGGSP